jgi:hypothetical protein
MHMTNAKIAAAACAALLVSGCGAYLHQSGLETSTTAVQKSFSELPVPAYFAAQRTTLKTHGDNEDRAIGAFVVAQRNAALMEVLRPSPLATASERTQLSTLVDRGLKQVFGKAPDKGDLEMFAKAPIILAHVRMQEDAAAADLRRSVRDYVEVVEQRNEGLRRNGQPEIALQPTKCANVPDVPAVAPTTRPERDYLRVQNACRLVKLVTEFREGEGSSGSGIAALYANSAGDLRSVLDALAERRRKRADAEAEAGRITAEIKALTEAAKAGDEASQARIRAAIAKLAAELQTAAPLAKEAGLEAIAGVLEEAASATLTPGADAEPGSMKARTAAALGVLYASAGLFDAYQSKPDVERGNAGLIGLALATHRLRMAKLDVQLEAAQIAFLEAELTALLQKAQHLSTARLLLDAHGLQFAEGWAELGSAPAGAPRTAAGEALSAYVASWDDGEAPYQMLRYRAVQADRLAAFERAVVTEADYRATLKPAVDQLAEYGKGGIREETIIDVLGRAGIAGAILEEK